MGLRKLLDVNGKQSHFDINLSGKQSFPEMYFYVSWHHRKVECFTFYFALHMHI